MSIRARCPQCAAEYNLADTLAGKKVRCKKCQALIAVPGPAEAVAPAPASTPTARPRRRDRDEDDAPPVKKKGSGLVLWLVLGGVGALLLLPLLCCGGVLMFAPIHITTTSGTSPATSGPVASGGGPTIVDEQPPAKEKDRAVVPNPVVPPNPAPDPNKDKKAPPPDKPNDPQPKLVPWRVQPDRPPPAPPAGDNPQGAIPITGGRPLPNTLVDQLVYPTSLSPFVCVAVKGKVIDALEVWNLGTMRRVGVAPTEPKDPYSIVALDPNSEFVAVPSFGLNPVKGADVYAVASPKVYPIKVTSESVFIDNIDFGRPGEFLTLRGTVTADGLGVLVQEWTITTGALARQFTAPAQLDRKLRAFSPTRRYMAMAAAKNDRVLFYDLPGGGLMGEAALPADSVCQGIAFSPDGNRVACLFKTGAATRLRAWDMGNGFQTADFTFDKAPMANVAAFRGPAIDFVPQGGSWLLYGQALVEDQTGTVYYRIPVEGADPAFPRRILGDGKLAYVKDEGRKRSLVFEALPQNVVDAMTKAARAGR